VTMGAGDIDEMAHRLVAALSGEEAS
jgi:hypothetical protein